MYSILYTYANDYILVNKIKYKKSSIHIIECMHTLIKKGMQTNIHKRSN